MIAAALHIIPGILGALTALSIYLQFNLGSWPREAEAACAIAAGWLTFAVVNWAVEQILRPESQAENMLADAGVDNDYSALRAAQSVQEAQARFARMQVAGARRREALKTALSDCEARFAALFADMLSSVETARRADTLLRRTLPRVESAFIDYCAFADRGDGLVDSADTRARLIAALQDASDAALRAQKSIIQTSAEEAEVSLQVLESTLTHSR